MTAHHLIAAEAPPPLLPGLWALLVVDRIPLQAATVPPPYWAEQ